MNKFTYADVVRLSRPEADVGTQATQVGTQSTHLGTQKQGKLGSLGTQSTQATLGTQHATEELLLTMPDPVATATRKDEREQLNLKLPTLLLEQIRRYAFENRITVKDFVVRAIKNELGTQGTQGRLGTQGRKLPTSDDDIDDDDQGIVELYEKATGNTFNERDHEVLTEYRHFGPRCLTLAILIGRNRYRKKINSLRFFEGNIREVAAWQPDKIERELPFQWSQFRRRFK